MRGGRSRTANLYAAYDGRAPRREGRPVGDTVRKSAATSSRTVTSRRAAEPPSRRAAEPPSRRAAEPTSRPARFGSLFQHREDVTLNARHDAVRPPRRIDIESRGEPMLAAQHENCAGRG